MMRRAFSHNLTAIVAGATAASCSTPHTHARPQQITLPGVRCFSTDPGSRVGQDAAAATNKVPEVNQPKSDATSPTSQKPPSPPSQEGVDGSNNQSGSSTSTTEQQQPPAGTHHVGMCPMMWFGRRPRIVICGGGHGHSYSKTAQGHPAVGHGSRGMLCCPFFSGGGRSNSSCCPFGGYSTAAASGTAGTTQGATTAEGGTNSSGSTEAEALKQRQPQGCCGCPFAVPGIILMHLLLLPLVLGYIAFRLLWLCSVAYTFYFLCGVIMGQHDIHNFPALPPPQPQSSSCYDVSSCKSTIKSQKGCCGCSD